VNFGRLPELLRSQPHCRLGLRSTRSIILLLSHLLAVHLSEFCVIQRLKHIADQISLSSSLQILAADPCSGCIFSTPQCQATQAMMTPDNAEAIIVFLFYCLAVHATRQERRKRP